MTDTGLAKRYLDLYDTTKYSKLYKVAFQELSPRLGAELPDSVRSAPRWGYVTTAGPIVHIESIEFFDPGAGARSLATWLESRGCRGLRYEVNAEGDEHEVDAPDSDGDESGGQ